MIIATHIKSGSKYLITSLMKDEDRFIQGRCSGASMWFGKHAYEFERVW